MMGFLEATAAIALGIVVGRVAFLFVTAGIYALQAKRQESKLAGDAEALIKRFEQQFGGEQADAPQQG